MISFTKGNVLESSAEALVNTVNTVGVMGKGIALMFKEAFPDNYREYRAACREHRVRVGEMFVVQREKLGGPKWIINFPTKNDWRAPSQMRWIEDGLYDLAKVIRERRIHSVAVPPLGAGNGGLDWHEVRAFVERILGVLPEVEVLVYEPTPQYQNIVKRNGVEALTAPRAMVAELVRRYAVLAMECSLLEIQKLAWFLERSLAVLGLPNDLHLKFAAHRYGPYAHGLTHLLDSLDGSFLHCDKRIADAGPLDAIWFDASKAERVRAYLASPDVKPYRAALDLTTKVIEGFQSPFGMELLATVDWLLQREGVDARLEDVRAALRHWPGGKVAAERKTRLFNDRMLSLSIKHLAEGGLH